ncbi:MAG: metalloprotease TldD [Gammaproteobacteria bacterium]|nr:metalloprotease TldD [Gammaproteobacteria bacterium]
MTDSLQLARSLILEPGGLTESALAQTLSMLMSHGGVDDADLYFQVSRYESWSLEDGRVKDGSYGIDQGVGVRAISGEKTGFAYSDEINLSALNEAANTVKAISRQGQAGKAKVFGKMHSGHHLYEALDPVASMSDQEKIHLMEKLDKAARAIDPRVTQVMISMVGVRDVMLVAGADGTLAADVRPLVRLSVSVVAEQNGRREQGSSGGGARVGFGYFLDDDRAMSYAREAVRQALVNLDAVDAPAGVMDVVLGPGWPGVLLHEAVGHGLEGDFNRKGSSAFSGRIGEKVASELCTVVDDGTLAQRRGSLNVDDEGTPTQCTTLIENGVLVGYIQDKHNARLMGMAPTGNGRRESYSHLPMPRMTNTYMLAGKHTPEEIIASIDRGLYAVNFGGGQVDITSGKFVFSASEAYLVEKGKIIAPVRGATLIGNGPEVMQRISMVGNNLQLDTGVGTCGKDGQSVPVGVGQPSMRVDQLTVGGTST